MNEVGRGMLTDFPILPQSATPTQALSILGEARLAVVVDSSQLPVALIIPRDLRRAARQGANWLGDPAAEMPPTVVASDAVDVADVLSYNVLPAFAAGARGVIFVSMQGRPTGVMALDGLLHLVAEPSPSDPMARLRFRAFTDYFFSREPPFDLDLLDGLLPVYPGTRSVRILARCRLCGHLNRLDFLDPKTPPPCQGVDRRPHTLRVS